MDPTFFTDPDALRAWFEVHHATTPEILIGFHRKGSGRPSITWPEAVDEALCVGWIDGVRRSIDSDSYSIRFTPRRPRSTWSAVNVKRVGELVAAGRMKPEGLRAFEERAPERTGIYAYERRHDARLERGEERQFRDSPAAWMWFEGQPRSYRATAIHWVVSAKKDETRRRRLTTLIEDSAEGRRIRPLRPRPRPG